MRLNSILRSSMLTSTAALVALGIACSREDKSSQIVPTKVPTSIVATEPSHPTTLTSTRATAIPTTTKPTETEAITPTPYNTPPPRLTDYAPTTIATVTPPMPTSTAIPTPPPTPEPTAIKTAIPTPTDKPTSIPKLTPTISPTPTNIPEPTAIPTPTPIPTSISDSYTIQNLTERIRIEYSTPTDETKRNQDLANVQKAYNFLENLQGSPDKDVKLVLKVDGEYVAIESDPINPLYHGARYKMALSGEDFKEYFVVNELSSWNTQETSPTDMRWFREGVSDIASTLIEENIDSKNIDYRFSRRFLIRNSAYKQLKDGNNIFKKEPRRLDAHSVGRMFVVGLEEYGIYNNKIPEFLKALDEIAEDGKTIGIEELKIAVEKVSSNDITPLINLLEPGIVYDFYCCATQFQELEFKKFAEKYPEYMNDNVSWLK